MVRKLQKVVCFPSRNKPVFTLIVFNICGLFIGCYNIFGVLLTNTTYLVGISIPATFDIPEPWFVPQNNNTKYKTIRIIYTSPRIFTKFC